MQVKDDRKSRLQRRIRRLRIVVDGIGVLLSLNMAFWLWSYQHYPPQSELLATVLSLDPVSLYRSCLVVSGISALLFFWQRRLSGQGKEIEDGKSDGEKGEA